MKMGVVIGLGLGRFPRRRGDRFLFYIDRRPVFAKREYLQGGSGMDEAQAREYVSSSFLSFILRRRHCA